MLRFIRKILDSTFFLRIINSSLVSRSRLNYIGRVFWKITPKPLRNSMLMRIESPIVAELSVCDGVLLSSKEDDHYLSLIQDGCKRWERATQDFWVDMSLKSRSIVDVGSYIGIYSIIAGKSNPLAEIIAIEPNPVTFNRLKSNIELNQLRNVSLHNVAVGDTKEGLDLRVSKSRPMSSGANLMGISEPGEILEFKVQQVTLDDLVESVDLIKIDAEGWEIKVLSGASRLLRECHPTVVCEILSAKQYSELENFMSSYGYGPPHFLDQKATLSLPFDSWITKGNYVFA